MTGPLQQEVVPDPGPGGGVCSSKVGFNDLFRLPEFSP